MKIRPVLAQLFRTDGRKDMKLIIAFRNFENAPQNCHIIAVLAVIMFIQSVPGEMRQTSQECSLS